MEQVFVTASGQLMERWGNAFPGATVVTQFAELTASNVSSTCIIWLDISVGPPPTRFSAITEAASLGVPVVAMAATPTEAEAFQALNVGAAGYCHLKAAPEQLLEIVQVVGHKGIWMPPELMQRLLRLSLRVVPPEPAAVPALDTLTARELMVAHQIATGATNREISECLEITERTVKAHLSAIFEKLKVRDRVQLALTMNNVSTPGRALDLSLEN